MSVARRPTWTFLRSTLVSGLLKTYLTHGHKSTDERKTKRLPNPWTARKTRQEEYRTIKDRRRPTNNHNEPRKNWITSSRDNCQHVSEYQSPFVTVQTARTELREVYGIFPISGKVRPIFFSVCLRQTYTEEDRPYLSKHWKNIPFPDREVSLVLFQVIVLQFFCWSDPLLQDPVLLFCRGGPCKHS